MHNNAIALGQPIWDKGPLILRNTMVRNLSQSVCQYLCNDFVRVITKANRSIMIHTLRVVNLGISIKFVSFKDSISSSQLKKPLTF